MGPNREDQSALGIQLKKMEEDCKDVRLDLSGRITELRDDLLNSIATQSTSAQLSLLPDISQQLHEIQSLMATVPIQHRILRQLIFDDMESRQNQIIDADASTCSWLLENSCEETADDSDSSMDSASEDSKEHGLEAIYRQATSRDFISWLRAGGDVFHISGNAGSGKSTLMKFIGRHERTRNELEAWAGPKRLVFGQFYFWNSGNKAQRTISGLQRTLLFQTLSQCPELIEDVFPLQMSQMKSSQFQSDTSVEKIQVFDSGRIQDAFHLLLEKTHHARHRFCFFIDGLDEYEGNRLAHEDLAAQLKGWTSGTDVKLLVSSRPWPEFHDIFKGNPSIHLHRLNAFDIKRYCSQQLEQDREVRTIGIHHMEGLIQELVQEITVHSQGIFLWAHLVLQATRQGIRQGDSTTVLMEKLKEFPPDLDDLYTKLREPIQKSDNDRIRSNRMLLLAANTPDEFRLVPVAFSWLGDERESGLLDPTFPAATTCQPYSAQEIATRLDRVTRQMHGLTRGLLETVMDSKGRFSSGCDGCLDNVLAAWRVRFCHRTARDYVLRTEERYKNLCDSWPDFDKSDVYGRIHLAKFIYGFRPGTKDRATHKYLGSYYCRDFSFNSIRKFEATLCPNLRPLFVSQDGHLVERMQKHQDHSPVSFLQYAAHCGLNRFVLAEIAAAPTKSLQSPGTNILISSLCAGINVKLCLSLLQQGVVDLESMIEIEISQGGTLMLPTWVVGLWELTRQHLLSGTSILHGFYGLDALKLHVQLVRHLHQHGVRAGQRLVMTVRLYRGGKGDEQMDLTSEQVVRWFEYLLASKMGQDSDGLEDALRTLNEWLEWAKANRSKGIRPQLVALNWQSQHVVLQKDDNEGDPLFRFYRVY